MSVEFQTSGAVNHGSGGSCSPGAPSGVIEGDLLKCFVWGFNDDDFLTPSTWTLLTTGIIWSFDGGSSGAARVAVFHKNADDDSTDTPTVEFDTSTADISAVILRFDGHDSASPIDAFTVDYSNDASDPQTCPDVVSSAADSLCVQFAGSYIGETDTTFASSNGFIQRANHTAGQDSAVVATKAVGAGSVGTTDYTLSTGFIRSGRVSIVIAPDPGGGGGPTYLDISGVAGVEAESDAQLSAIHSVSAQLEAECEAQGAIGSLASIEGLASADTEISGEIGSVFGISGESAAEAVTDGSASLVLNISSVVRANASSNASASMQKGASGELSAAAKALGSAALIKNIIGDIAAEPSVQGSFAKIISLAAAFGADASCSATISSEKGISGTVSATAGFTGELVDGSILDISGSAGVIAEIAADISKLVAIGGEASTIVTAEGNVSLTLSVSGTTESTAQFSGAASLLLGISGSLEAITAFTGNLDKYDVNSLQALVIDSVIIGPRLQGSAKLSTTLSGIVGGGPELDVNKIVIH